MKNQEKSHADSAARSRESYKNDLEKSRDDSAARSREHRRRNRGAWGASAHSILCYVLRSLQLSKTDIQLIISVYVMSSILLVRRF